MAGPEGARRRGILFRTTAPRETAISVLPKPPTEPALTPEPGKPPTRKSLIQRLAGNLFLRGILAGTALAGTGIYAAYQEIPTVHQSIDKLKEGVTSSWNDFITPERPVPTPPNVFDGNALAGTISENNGMVMSKEQAKQLFPQPIVFNEQTRTATIFNFLEPPEGETITWTRIPVVNGETGILMHAWQGTLPAGTKIKVSPVTSEYVSNGAGYLQDWKGGKNPERGDMIGKFSYDLSKDRTIIVSIGSVTGWFVFPSEMQNLPTYPSMDVLKRIPENTVIATTTQSTLVDIVVKTFPGKTLDGANVNQQVPYSANFFSVPSPDGTGNRIVDVK